MSDTNNIALNLQLTRNEVSALAIHLRHRKRPAYGWMESSLVEIEEKLKETQDRIHKEDFVALELSFHSNKKSE